MPLIPWIYTIINTMVYIRGSINYIIFFIKLYQKLISPIKRPSCRFTPTCSRYAVCVLLKCRLFYGLELTLLRILKCNPYFLKGCDLAPSYYLSNYKSFLI